MLGPTDFWSVISLQGIHLGAARSSAPFRVKRKELLGQLHLQVAVHRAVVVAGAAGLQNEIKKGGQEMKNGGEWRDEQQKARRAMTKTPLNKRASERERERESNSWAPSNRPPPVFSHSASASLSTVKTLITAHRGAAAQARGGAARRWLLLHAEGRRHARHLLGGGACGRTRRWRPCWRRAGLVALGGPGWSSRRRHGSASGGGGHLAESCWGLVLLKVGVA